MSISLQKNQSINLSKTAVDLSKGSRGLSEVVIGLGWDAATEKKGFFGSLFGSSNSSSIDCDASVVACRNGHFVSNDDLIYYGHLSHSSGAILHHGDNLTGDGDGDDEQIEINFNTLPSDVDKIGVVVNIFNANSKHQHFGMIENAFVRIFDKNTNQELCKYNLSDNYSGKIAMIFGELYRENGEWQFRAVGEGTNDSSVNSLANRYA